MDNEAFRALVAKAAAPKSTKEIAREAVQEEADRRKRQKTAVSGRRKKRKGEDDYDDEGDDFHHCSREAGSSSDDSIPRKEQEPNESKEPKWKEEWREKRRKLGKSLDAEPKYRDRAKERRKGLNLDYKDTSDLIKDANNVDKDMSKYLGGDYEHTHLVKGLDFALAEKAKLEEAAKRLADRKNALTSGHRHEAGKHISEQGQWAIVNEEGLKENILRLSQPPTALGQSMLAFLQSMLLRLNRSSIGSSAASSSRYNLHPVEATVVPTPAGRAIQRTSLLFTVDGNPYDWPYAWETPTELTMSRSLADERYDSSKNSWSKPFDGAIIERMYRAFSSIPREHKKMNSVSHKQKRVAKNQASEKAEGKISVRCAQENGPISRDLASGDEDDDIFGSIGEYIPPTANIGNDKPN